MHQHVDTGDVMDYRLTLVECNAELVFNSKSKLLTIKPLAGETIRGFQLNHVGLAVVQRWLAMLDLSEAHKSTDTRKILKELGLSPMASGYCAKHNKSFDDCGCILRAAAQQDPDKS